MQQPEKRLVIVSNRLPVVLEKQQGSWHVSHGAGGLVTALAPVLVQKPRRTVDRVARRLG